MGAAANLTPGADAIPAMLPANAVAQVKNMKSAHTLLHIFGKQILG